MSRRSLSLVLLPQFSTPTTRSPTKVFLHLDYLPIDLTDIHLDWNPITKEAAMSGTLSPMAVYSASKKFAELAVWEWAEAHPHVEVTTSRSSDCLLRLT